MSNPNLGSDGAAAVDEAVLKISYLRARIAVRSRPRELRKIQEAVRAEARRIQR